jgi:AcrR family transcriptional regulator
MYIHFLACQGATSLLDPADAKETYVDALPAAQERSRRTRDRLLDAAEAVLARDGLDGATVPAIARKAGVAVGSVYRRFPDKDALMRGVYERFFRDGTAINRWGLAPEQWQGMDAATAVRHLVAGMVRGYRLKKPLWRALLLYGETHADPEFRRRALELREETFRLVGDLIVARATEVGHPRPRDAVVFALSVMRMALQGFVLHEEREMAMTDEALTDELTRLVAGYLGV